MRIIIREHMDDKYRMKIAMLGEGGVGKTCLINRYISNIFENTTSTSAATYNSYSLCLPNGQMEIRQMIWDTAGQECYRSLASFYYRDADAVVLVYDITNYKSFEALEFWLKSVRTETRKDVLITIAGNKCDKIDAEEVVDMRTAKEFAKNNDASIFFVSAKENTNVNEMYLELGIRMFPEFRAISQNGKHNDERPSRRDVDVDKRESSTRLSARIMRRKKNNCC
eukprot:TRINITY_DN7813_c0_g1_i1.p1 TRINITY_DN7813_c0_g1~~TRINITY_DN7813_c0_g1_i1.p1  ORF type:complete len:225 (+),score=29.43 TRINITY_DN7813_c0_g1_i1:161-835(+)